MAIRPMNDKNVFSYKLNCNKVITILQSRVALNFDNTRKCNKLISWFKIASDRIFKQIAKYNANLYI